MGDIQFVTPQQVDAGSLFAGLNPEWQLAAQKVAQGNTFSNGLPTDAGGNPDYAAMAKTLMQKGAIDEGIKLYGAGLQQQAIKSLGADNLLTGAPPAQPAVASGPGALPVFQKAIAGVESGGNYGALGPQTDAGDRAYGKYQVMGANIPSWSKEILGTALTPEQFLSNPQAQDAIFNGKFGQYLKQYGTPQDAASMWFTGKPYAQGAGLKDQLGTTGSGYVTKFLAGLPRGGAQDASVPQQQPQGAQPSQAQSQPDQQQAAQGGGSDPSAPSSVHPFGPPATADGTVTNGPASNAAPTLPQPTQVAGPGAPSAPALQPSQNATAPSAVDPTLGGLLKGAYVGNPGAYISALRQRAAQYGAAGVTGAETAYNKQADTVEQALVRSETPLLKNYATAIRQGYPGTVMQFASDTAGQAEAARIQAQGNPAAIRAAGQKAQAEADARNASEVAAAGQKAEATQEGAALGKLPATLAAAADGAKLQTNLVDQMLDAANTFRMGPGATTQQNVNAKLIALGDYMGVDTSSLKTQNAGYTDFAKLAGQLTRQSIKETGSSRAGIQEMQLVAGTLPSPDMTRDGFVSVAEPLKGLADFTVAKQQAGDAWLNKTGSMKGFEADWNKNISPAAFVLHRMQVDQPALFQQTVQRMATTPQGRGVLANVKNGLSWGSQAGLF